jgi:hypothetical protein
MRLTFSPEASLCKQSLTDRFESAPFDRAKLSKLHVVARTGTGSGFVKLGSTRALAGWRPKSMSIRPNVSFGRRGLLIGNWAY